MNIPHVFNLDQAILCARRQHVRYWCIGHSPLTPGLHYFFTSTPVYKFADLAWYSEQAQLFTWYSQPRPWSNSDVIGLKYDTTHSNLGTGLFNVDPKLVAKGTKSQYWNWSTKLHTR